jgi:hypothetical protein
MSCSHHWMPLLLGKLMYMQGKTSCVGQNSISYGWHLSNTIWDSALGKVIFSGRGWHQYHELMPQSETNTRMIAPKIMMENGWRVIQGYRDKLEWTLTIALAW